MDRVITDWLGHDLIFVGCVNLESPNIEVVAKPSVTAGFTGT